MNRCPTCGRRYPADTAVCPADGAPLAAEAHPPAAAPLGAPPPVAAPSARWLPVLVGVLAVVVVGLVGAVLWQQQTALARSEAAAAEATAAANEAVQDAARQRDEADRLAGERNAAEQAAAASRAAAARAAVPVRYTRTVWANSPNDGFLALRSAPTTGRGTRLLQIPHGAPLDYGDCLAPTTTPGGRYGSWCRARYAGVEGWAFSAFVTS